MNWFKRFWDWVDEREIDKHAISWLIVGYGLFWLTPWAMKYANESPRPGIDIAAILGAVTAPYTLLIGAVINYYLKARTQP